MAQILKVRIPSASEIKVAADTTSIVELLPNISPTQGNSNPWLYKLPESSYYSCFHLPDLSPDSNDKNSNLDKDKIHNNNSDDDNGNSNKDNNHDNNSDDNNGNSDKDNNYNNDPQVIKSEQFGDDPSHLKEIPSKNDFNIVQTSSENGANIESSIQILSEDRDLSDAESNVENNVKSDPEGNAKSNGDY